MLVPVLANGACNEVTRIQWGIEESKHNVPARTCAHGGDIAGKEKLFWLVRTQTDRN